MYQPPLTKILVAPLAIEYHSAGVHCFELLTLISRNQGTFSAGARPTEAPKNVTWGPLYPQAKWKE